MVGASARYSCLHTPVETGTAPRESESFLLTRTRERKQEGLAFSLIKNLQPDGVPSRPAAVKPQGSGYSLQLEKLHDV